MSSNENYRGGKHRMMSLVYITWLTLSLAPAMVAPPEKGFVQGQPEMQLAMDNMVPHKTIIKKRMNAPSSDATDYHAMLTAKTSKLLSEAENVLSSLPNSKERQWIETFVHRMRGIETMLEKTAQNNNKVLPNNLNTMSGTPVPEGLPLQPTWPATSAVPGINPFQKPNRMMSKFPVTSPELSKVLPANEYPSERQAVTKPAVVSNNKEVEEDDELVQELENLHQEFSQQAPSENSKIIDQVPIFTTPSTPALVESSSDKTIDAEAEKNKLQAKLIQELAEFQHLGGVIPSGIINALYTDNQKETGLVQNQNSNIDDKLKYTEAGMIDRQGMLKLSDLNDESKEIEKKNLQNSVLEKNIPYEAERYFPQIKHNHPFQNIQPNFHANLPAYSKQNGNPFSYIPSQNKDFNQEDFKNRNLDFQKPNPYNHGNYHLMIGPANQLMSHMPDALKQMLSKPQNKFHNGYLMRNGYGPRPYLHNFGLKNSTLSQSPMMSPYLIKQPINHQSDIQLSDEMKRQLRDGKIIVLSDSVVRSNFELSKSEKATDIPPNMSKSENVDLKNVTTSKN